MPSVLRAVEDDHVSPGLLRTPPQNPEAERALLGAVLLNNRAYERVSDFLRAEHFSDPVNGCIYAVMAQLIDRGQAANPVTLKTYLERDELVAAAGGMKYLANLANSVVTVINAADYGALVLDLWQRRELINFGEDVVNRAFDAALDETARDQIETAESLLFGMTEDRTSAGPIEFGAAIRNAAAEAQAAHQRGGALIGVTTGLRDLDAKLGGLHPSDLIILAGRPGMGKTALATKIAWRAAEYFAATDRIEDRGKRVVFFSLEMSHEQLTNRILAEQANVDAHQLRQGHLDEAAMERYVRACGALSDLPLHIDDTAAATVAQIRARARRLARRRARGDENGLGLIVIDYLQLIAPGGRERPENRVQELSAITRGLKALAKDLDVPVLALSQLSRAVEQREDKRPQLSDLRESGTIEQDSDVVMFVFREEYYLDRQEPNDTSKYDAWQSRLAQVRNLAEIIVGKQRHGPIGTVRAHFNASRTSFTDLETQHAGAMPDGRPEPPVQQGLEL